MEFFKLMIVKILRENILRREFHSYTDNSTTNYGLWSGFISATEINQSLITTPAPVDSTSAMALR